MTSHPQFSLPKAAPIQEAQAHVLSNTAVNAEYRLMHVQAPPEMAHCQPGQFFHLLCPTDAGTQPFLRRPMSIYDFAPDTGALWFLYKVTGAGTRGLSHLRDGDMLNLVGPLGHGFDLDPAWTRLLVVARGVGLATLAPLAKVAQSTGRRLTAICSARSPDLLMSTDIFEAAGCEVITLTDSEGTSDMDHLRRTIETLIAKTGVDAMFTCGSNRILTLLQSIGAEHGIPGQVALEQQMACGLGMCQCCVRPFREEGGIVQKRVCREGPVFDLQKATAC